MIKKENVLDSANRRKAQGLEQLLAMRQRVEQADALPEQSVEPTHLSIVHIAPDPFQPRRAMPDVLRARWCAGEDLRAILAEWERVAQALLNERGYDTRWGEWIEPDLNAELLPDLSTAHPHLRMWNDLLRLAGSIFRDGLAVPISVYQDGSAYRLLMGERRLLAFCLLTWMGYDGFQHIPALVAPRYDPVQQAVENGARKDLNAIGVARQLAVLLMSFNGIQVEGSTQPAQGWYAQAYDLRVPRGYADALATVLGLSHTRQISQYRDLLTLPKPVWNWADEFSWPEGKLRALRQKATSDEQLIQLAQAEVALALGSAKRAAPTVAQRVSKAAGSAEKALERVITLDDKALRAMGESQRRHLRELAQALLKRL